MMGLNRRKHTTLLMVCLMALATVVGVVGDSTPARSATEGSEGTGAELATITFASGAVGVWPEGGNAWLMVQDSRPLHMGDHVRTGEESRAVIEFVDGSEVLLHEQTTLQITPREPVDEPKGVAARVKVSLGQIFNRITPERSDLEFETPDAVAAIRGTNFYVQVGSREGAQAQLLSAGFGPESPAPLSFESVRSARDGADGAGSRVLVVAGMVEVFNDLGTTMVGPGQITSIRTNESPTPAAPASPDEIEEATAWVEQLDEDSRPAEADAAALPVFAGTRIPPAPFEPSEPTVPIGPDNDGHTVIKGGLTVGDIPVAHTQLKVARWEDTGTGLEETDEVFGATTDENGGFQVVVPPGTYRIGAGDMLFGPDSGMPAPVVGGVLAWMSEPISVGEGQSATYHGDLGFGHEASFALEIPFSLWGSESAPWKMDFYGGSGDGQDTFVLHLDDLVGVDNEIELSWTLPSIIGDGQVTHVNVFREGFWDEALGGLDVEPGSSTPLSNESFDISSEWGTLRVAVMVEQGEENFVLYGPKIAFREFPSIASIDRRRVVWGEGGDRLEVTLYGENLDLLLRVSYGRGIDLDIGEPSEVFQFEDVEPKADGTAVKVTEAWGNLAGGDPDPRPGRYVFGIAYGADHFAWLADPTEHPVLTVTSTNLSGNGPEAIPERGDLQRSGTGLGPVGSLTEVLWGDGDGVSGNFDSMPQFAGDWVYLRDNYSFEVRTFTTEGSEVSDPITSVYNTPLTVATDNSGNGKGFFQESGPEMDVQDMVVHDGILVVATTDGLQTYDAGDPAVPLGSTFLPLLSEAGEYRLAISDGPGGPFVHVVGHVEWGYPVVRTFDLYTLAPVGDWGDVDFGGVVSDFAVGPGGHTLYVVAQDDGPVIVAAFETGTGALRWWPDLVQSVDESRLQSVKEGSLVVHPDGRVFVLGVGSNESGVFLFELSESGDVQVIDGSELDVEAGSEIYSQGIALAKNTHELFGFVTAGSSGDSFTTLFRYDTAGNSETLELLNPAFDLLLESPVHGMKVALGGVWLRITDSSSDGYRFVKLVGDQNSEHGLPDPPLHKRADRTIAQIGDVITYTITFDNTELVGDETRLIEHDNVWIQDVLPPGFVFVEGSSYVYLTGPGDQNPIALEPATGSKGRTLQFELADAANPIPENGKRTLTYQVVVGPRVVEGAVYTNEAVGYYDGSNTIRGVLEANNLCDLATARDAVTDLPMPRPTDCDHILTNVARADVRIVPGVFSMQGTIVGKVFYDEDGDGFQSEGEPGIAGARIVMETGVTVVTDGYGKFSLSNLTPGLHVLKLDETSIALPRGVTPSGDGSDILAQGGFGIGVHWNVAGGTYRLVDLAGGGLFTVNFALQPTEESGGGAE